MVDYVYSKTTIVISWELVLGGNQSNHKKPTDLQQVNDKLYPIKLH